MSRKVTVLPLDGQTAVPESAALIESAVKLAKEPITGNSERFDVFNLREKAKNSSLWKQILNNLSGVIQIMEKKGDEVTVIPDIKYCIESTDVNAAGKYIGSEGDKNFFVIESGYFQQYKERYINDSPILPWMENTELKLPYSNNVGTALGDYGVTIIEQENNSRDSRGFPVLNKDIYGMSIKNGDTILYNSNNAYKIYLNPIKKDGVPILHDKKLISFYGSFGKSGFNTNVLTQTQSTIMPYSFKDFLKLSVYSLTYIFKPAKMEKYSPIDLILSRLKTPLHRLIPHT